MPFFDWHVLSRQNTHQLRAELVAIGADVALLSDPNVVAATHAIKLAHIQPKLARFLYQEMLLEGGMIALPAKMDDRTTAPVDVIIFGTRTQLEHLAVRLETQSDSELDLLAAELRDCLQG
jgi:hypothetical protein